METPASNTALKKLENIWYYHKMKFILSLFVALILIIWFTAFRDNTPPADVTVVIWGADEISDALSEGFNSIFDPAIKDVNNDGIKRIALAPSKIPQKAYLMLGSGDAQAVILNGNDFRIYAKQGTFRPLDDLVKKYSYDITLHPEIKMAAQQDSTEHIYGIPLEGNKLLSKLGQAPANMYFAVTSVGDEKDNKMLQNALILVETLLKNK